MEECYGQHRRDRCADCAATYDRTQIATESFDIRLTRRRGSPHYEATFIIPEHLPVDPLEGLYMVCAVREALARRTARNA